jgi:hypothetical protein
MNLCFKITQTEDYELLIEVGERTERGTGLPPYLYMYYSPQHVSFIIHQDVKALFC